MVVAITGKIQVLPALKPEQHQSAQLSLGYHLLLPYRMSQKNMMFPY